MNPMDWLKAIYETFGTPYPRSSLIVVTFLGAILFAAVWLFGAKQVEKDHLASTAPSRVTGSASTSGDRSPAVTGDQNDINYEQPSGPAKKSEPTKKK